MRKLITSIFKTILPKNVYDKLWNAKNYIHFKVSPKGYISEVFHSAMGYEMSWENPKDLNEKINWMKLYSDTTEWTRLADKYRVREFIEEKGYKHFLVPLLGKWDCVEDIEWNALPNQFVMKMNNGSGDILLCKDKSQLDIPYWTRKYKTLFKKKFGESMGEMHYAKMKPCIIAEELLDVTKQPIKTSSLIDYKIWCFKGEIASIWVCFNRTKDNVQVASYDTNWIKHPEHSVSTNHYILTDAELPRPVSLDEMLKFAADISKDFPQLRLDMYEVDGKPYFGEMTFTSNAGFMNFYTRDYMLELGEKVKLSL